MPLFDFFPSDLLTKTGGTHLHQVGLNAENALENRRNPQRQAKTIARKCHNHNHNNTTKPSIKQGSQPLINLINLEVRPPSYLIDLFTPSKTNVHVSPHWWGEQKNTNKRTNQPNQRLKRSTCFFRLNPNWRSLLSATSRREPSVENFWQVFEGSLKRRGGSSMGF